MDAHEAAIKMLAMEMPAAVAKRASHHPAGIAAYLKVEYLSVSMQVAAGSQEAAESMGMRDRENAMHALLVMTSKQRETIRAAVSLLGGPAEAELFQEAIEAELPIEFSRDLFPQATSTPDSKSKEATTA